MEINKKSRFICVPKKVENKHFEQKKKKRKEDRKRREMCYLNRILKKPLKRIEKLRARNGNKPSLELTLELKQLRGFLKKLKRRKSKFRKNIVLEYS